MLICGIADEAAVRLEDQIRVHRDLNLKGLEIRTVEGRWAHELTEAETDLIAAAIINAGLTVPVIDTPIGGWATTIASDFDAEVEILRASAATAHRLGCRLLRIMSYPTDGRSAPDWHDAVLRRLGELTAHADSLGVSLLHENCHGWGGQTAEATLDLVHNAKNLRLIFDIGNGLAFGYDAVVFLRQVIPFVDHVHVKDGVRKDGEVVFGLPGEGEAGVAECVRMLAANGFIGWYSLEPHVAYLPHSGVASGQEQREAAYRACVGRFVALAEEVGRTSA